MEPSSVQNGHIRGDVRTNDTKLQQLAGQRQLLVSKVSGLRNFLELTKLPHSSLTAKFFGEVDQPAVKSPVSLLDESVADSDQTPERNLVAKILSMVDRLRLITKDSKLCVEELGRRIQADDISSILMLNVGREEEIYKAELQKFSQFERQMEAMTRESQQILAQVGEGISLLQQTSKTWMKMEKTDRNSKGLTRQWESDLVVYIETKSSLEGHSLALRDVNRGLARARNAAINFANQRLIERQNLAGRIDSNQAEASQRALRAQLDRLQVEGSTNNSYLQNNMSSTPSPVVQTSLPPPTYGLPQPGLSKPQEQSSSPYSISQSQYGAQNTLPSPNAGSLSQMPSYSTTQGSQAFSGPSLSQHQVYNPAPSNFSHLQSNPISPQTNYSQNSSLPPPSVKLYSANQYSQPVQQQPPSQS